MTEMPPTTPLDPPPAKRLTRSSSDRMLAGFGAIVLGLGAAAAVAFGAGAAVAAVVLAAGIVLIIGAFAGGARWLIAPALILAIPVAIVSAADLDLKGGVGQRDYRPAS